MDAPQLPIPGMSGYAAEHHYPQQQQQHQQQQEYGNTAEDTTTVPSSNANNGYSSDSRAQYGSRGTPQHEFAQESDPTHRSNQSPSLSTYQPQLPSSSRPGSGLSSGPERYGAYSQQMSQEVTQRPQQQQQQASQASKNSVVIKVGMVGDAQIGKTSLMVKYVEGSWDEDYIQTLGISLQFVSRSILQFSPLTNGLTNRRQLHGKNHLDPQHGNHVLNLGLGWPARIRQHASPRMQRRRGDPLHVRPYAQEHPQFHQGVVPPGTWV